MIHEGSLQFSALVTLANAWNYDSLGEDWTEATCAGSNQSPINIVKADAYPAFHSSLRIACAQVTGTFKNEDGNLLKFELPDGKAVVSSNEFLTGGPFGTTKYYFLHFLLHWGSTDCEGSEHTVDFNRCLYT